MAASKARNVPVGTGQAGMMRAPKRGRINVDTTAEPEGLTRRVILNVLEAFFRRPWLHLLPLLLLLILGGVTAFNKDPVYKSTGTMTVSAASSTLVGSLTQGNNQGFTYDSPATVVARNVNEQLSTTSFLNAIAGKIENEPSDAERKLLRDVITKDVTAYADGASLVRISASSERSDLSLRLAQATIDSYREAVLNDQVSQTKKDVTFFEAQQADAQKARDAARTALTDFATVNNVTATTDLPYVLEVQLKEKEDAVASAQTAYDAATQRVNDAQVKVNASTTAVDQQLQVTDSAEAATAPEPRLKKAALTLVVFGVLGLLLSLASIIVSAALDHTIRVPGDVTAKFDLDVLAVVPDARAR